MLTRGADKLLASLDYSLLSIRCLLRFMKNLKYESERSADSLFGSPPQYLALNLMTSCSTGEPLIREFASDRNSCFPIGRRAELNFLQNIISVGSTDIIGVTNPPRATIGSMLPLSILLWIVLSFISIFAGRPTSNFAATMMLVRAPFGRLLLIVASCLRCKRKVWYWDAAILAALTAFTARACAFACVVPFGRPPLFLSSWVTGVAIRVAGVSIDSFF